MVLVGTSICCLLVLTLTQRRLEEAGPAEAGGASALFSTAFLRNVSLVSPEAQGLASFCT